MFTFYDAREALTSNIEIANRYSSDLLDDVARWLVCQGGYVVGIPFGSPVEADRFVRLKAKQIMKEFFDWYA